MLRCPNCSAPVQGEPVQCAQCGYRSSMAAEYFWLYLGGILFVLAGFALGALGVLVEGSRPDHWSRSLSSWFPLAPWPASHHWLAFVVAGIGLTLMGLGVTRRRRDALAALLGFLPYSLTLAGLAAAGVIGTTAETRTEAMLVLALEAPLALLLVRIAVAYARTPPRRLPHTQAIAASTPGAP